MEAQQWINHIKVGVKSLLCKSRRNDDRDDPSAILPSITMTTPVNRDPSTGALFPPPLRVPPRSTNLVRTSKYTAYNFLFNCGLKQFQHLSNVYFVVIFVLALVGNQTSLFDSPLPSVGFLLSLALVISFTMIFEGYYDLKRHREDRKMNNRTTERLRFGDGLIEHVAWSCVVPGDVLKIRDRTQVPADMILLTTSTNDNKCYLETANIDGETNLKVKRVPPGLVDRCCAPEMAASLHAEFQYDAPNSFLKFSGTAKLLREGEDETIPLDFDHLLLRGSVLRNTPWVLGMVVYAGPETKVSQSSNNPPVKQSRVMVLVNQMILVILMVGLLICIISAIVSLSVTPDGEYYYLFNTRMVPNDYSGPAFFSNILTFVILYSNLVPIALLICVTTTNTIQAMFINWDLAMFDGTSGTPAKCNTLELVQELGQVSYLFSDKTGTLTRNEMKLVGMAVGGTIYGLGSEDQDTVKYSSDSIRHIFGDLIAHIRSGGPNTSNIEEFLTIISVCHTVLVDVSTGEIKYNAEGPDEEALVEAASLLGFKLVSTDNGIYTVEISFPKPARPERPSDDVVSSQNGPIVQVVETAIREEDDDNATILESSDSSDDDEAVAGAMDEAGEAQLTLDETQGSNHEPRVEHINIGDPSAADTEQEESDNLEDAIEKFEPVVVQFEILAVNHFNSTRKRMSCVVRLPNGKLVLMCKGADSVMFERMSPDAQAPGQMEVLGRNLDEFAKDGLRTLVIARRYLEIDDYMKWRTKYDKALTALGDLREEKLIEAAEEIEKDLVILGATAIEDRLQDKVRETLTAIKDAGVKVWVLTGDKVETAINIAFSAELLKPDMHLVEVKSDDPQANQAAIAELNKVITPENLEYNSSLRKNARQIVTSEGDPYGVFQSTRRAWDKVNLVERLGNAMNSLTSHHQGQEHEKSDVSGTASKQSRLSISNSNELVESSTALSDLPDADGAENSVESQSPLVHDTQKASTPNFLSSEGPGAEKTSTQLPEAGDDQRDMVADVRHPQSIEETGQQHESDEGDMQGVDNASPRNASPQSGGSFRWLPGYQHWLRGSERRRMKRLRAQQMKMMQQMPLDQSSAQDFGSGGLSPKGELNVIPEANDSEWAGVPPQIPIQIHSPSHRQAGLNPRYESPRHHSKHLSMGVGGGWAQEAAEEARDALSGFSAGHAQWGDAPSQVPTHRRARSEPVKFGFEMDLPFQHHRERTFMESDFESGDESAEDEDVGAEGENLYSSEDFEAESAPLKFPNGGGSMRNLDTYEADNMALVISGKALEGLLKEENGTEETEAQLLRVARLCSVVLCCRVSPRQKALLVRMVKEGVKVMGTEPVTMAIGDGANDVAMIQEARVGVGINGHEGAQAANSADFAIAQFRFLKRLMLVHGRWNYRRMATVVLFVFYSNVMFVFSQFYFNFYNKFSGSSLYFVFLLIFYSYPTNIPILFVGALNKDISASTALRYPAMYISGRANLDLGMFKIVEYIIKSIVHAMIICGYQITWCASLDIPLNVMGTSIYLNCVVVSLTQTCFEIFTWTRSMYLVLLAAGCAFLVAEPMYYNADPSVYTTYGGSVLFGSAEKFAPRHIWTVTVLSTVTCMCFGLCITWLRRQLFPTLVDMVIEVDRGVYSGVKQEKRTYLREANRALKRAAQPLKLPKKAISELLSTTSKIDIAPSFRSGFAFDPPALPFVSNYAVSNTYSPGGRGPEGGSSSHPRAAKRRSHVGKLLGDLNPLSPKFQKAEPGAGSPHSTASGDTGPPSTSSRGRNPGAIARSLLPIGFVLGGILSNSLDDPTGTKLAARRASRRRTSPSFRDRAASASRGRGEHDIEQDQVRDSSNGDLDTQSGSVIDSQSAQVIESQSQQVGNSDVEFALGDQVEERVDDSPTNAGTNAEHLEVNEEPIGESETGEHQVHKEEHIA